MRSNLSAFICFLGSLLISGVSLIAAAPDDLFEQHRKMMEKAIHEHDLDKVKVLMESPYVLLEKNQYVFIALVELENHGGDTRIIKALADKGAMLVVSKPRFYATALERAVLGQVNNKYDARVSEDLVEYFLSKGMSPSLDKSLWFTLRSMLGKQEPYNLLSVQEREQMYTNVFLKLLAPERRKNPRTARSFGWLNSKKDLLAQALRLATPETIELAKKALQQLIDLDYDVLGAKPCELYGRYDLDSVDWVLDVLGRNAQKVDLNRPNPDSGITAIDSTYLTVTSIDGRPQAAYLVSSGRYPESAKMTEGRRKVRAFLLSHGIPDHVGDWPNRIGTCELVKSPWP